MYYAAHDYNMSRLISNLFLLLSKTTPMLQVLNDTVN